MGLPLARLEARGIEPWRGGHRLRVDNPLILAGDSSVSVRIDRRGECHVAVAPIYPIEVRTLEAVTSGALAVRGAVGTVRFLRSGDGFVVIFG
jgi:hypothetical protein